MLFDEAWPWDRDAGPAGAGEHAGTCPSSAREMRLGEPTAPELVDLIDPDVSDDFRSRNDRLTRRICSAAGFSHSRALETPL